MAEYDRRRLTEAGARLEKARRTLQDATRNAMWRAQEAADEGVPETVIAKDLGVDRARTLRKWLGK